MVSLCDLGQLLRVAEQHDVVGGQADRRGVRERELARLVDEDEAKALVMVGAGEEPGGTGNELVLVVYAGVVVGLVDQLVRAVVALALVDAGEGAALLVRASFDISEEVLNGGVARCGDPDPAPGGIFGFSLTFSHPTPSRIKIDGTVCLQVGPVCSTGPSNGLSAEVNLSGYVDIGDTTVGIDLNAGKVRHADIGIDHLSGDFKVNYVVSRGQGAADNPDPPVVRLPIGAGVSIPPPYGIPIYLKLQLAVLLKLGVSSKNAVIRGSAEVTTNGSEQISETGNKVTPSGSDTVTGQITPGASESLAASGVVVAAQFPKLGVGLGTNVVNGIAFVDVVESMGQTVGSALAGQFCSSYDLFVDVGGGFEAQVGPFITSKKSPIIPQKKFQLAQPGLPADLTHRVPAASATSSASSAGSCTAVRAD